MKEDEFWLDVEQSQIERLTKHLKMYSLRKKIEITDLSKEMKIFAVNVFFLSFFSFFHSLFFHCTKINNFDFPKEQTLFYEFS